MFKIVLDPSLPEFVLLAARDLAADFGRVRGVRPAIVRGGAAAPGDVLVATAATGAGREACDIATGGGILQIVGSDPRGAMRGIYAVAGRVLGVDPLSFWNDAPDSPDSAAPCGGRPWEGLSLHLPQPAFRFRGWFVNDEDLLTGWSPAADGVRDLGGYPYYRDIVSPEVMERIAEAAVRCGCNTIIPASFLNILNPPEARLAEICAARGLFVSQHHVEPLGASAFTFKAYWRARGRDIPFSWTSHPREVEEVWRATARRWARLPNVIWQLGLRGEADQPMWRADPTAPKSDAERAAVIFAAMARQLEILDEIGVPRKGRVATATLWGEGAPFFRRGLLDIPDGVIAVVSDNGPAWRWPDGAFERAAKGIYCHHAVIGCGPHLAPLVPPERATALPGGAIRAEADEYALFNVSNIREFCRGIAATSEALLEGKAFDFAHWNDGWLSRHFPASDRAAWGAVFAAYDAAPAVHPDTGWPLFLDGHIQKTAVRKVFEPFERGEVPQALPSWDPFPAEAPLIDVFSASIRKAFDPNPGSREAAIAALEAQSGRFDAVVDAATPLFDRLPAESRDFAYSQLLHPALLMRDLSAWLLALLRAQEASVSGNRPASARHFKAALVTIDAILAREPMYCRGKWRNWWRGCRKIDLRSLRDRTAAFAKSMQTPKDLP